MPIILRHLRRFGVDPAPEIKLAALFAAGLGLFLSDNIRLLISAGAAVIALYALIGFSPRSIARRLQPAALLALLLFLFQYFAADYTAAIRAGARLFALLSLAGLITATTAGSALLAAMERALRRLQPLGLNPRKTALALALTVRFIPLAQQIWHDSAAAQQARGGSGHSLPRLSRTAGLLLTRLAELSGLIAQAIEARGFDDTEEPRP